MATSARQLSSGHIINDLRRTVPVWLPKHGPEQQLVELRLPELMQLADSEPTRVAAQNVIRARINRMNHFRKYLGEPPLETPSSAADWEQKLFAEAKLDPRVTAHSIKSALAQIPHDLREIPLRTLVASRDLTAIEVAANGRTVEDGRAIDYMSIRRPLDSALQAIGKSFATKEARQALRGIERAITQMKDHPPRFFSFGEQQTRALRSALEKVDNRLTQLSEDPNGFEVDLDLRQRGVEAKAYRRASKEAVARISESAVEMRAVVGQSTRLTMSEFSAVQLTLNNLQNDLRAMEQTQGIDTEDAHQTVAYWASADAVTTRLHSYTDAVSKRSEAAKFFLDRHPAEVRTKGVENRSARSMPASERGSDDREAIFAADVLITARDAEFQEGVWDLRGRLSAQPGASYQPMFLS